MSIIAEFSLPVTAFPSGRTLGPGSEITFELERVVPTGSVTFYLWVVGDDHRSAIETLRVDPSIESLDTLDELADRALVRVHWKHGGRSVFEFIERNGRLVDANGSADGWAVTIDFPDWDALTAFYEVCRQKGIALELRGLNESGFRTNHDIYGLSPAQRETVATAFEAGYFDVPRRTTIAELAEGLGVSNQAVSERLRRGLAKYLSTTFSEESRESTSEDDT